MLYATRKPGRYAVAPALIVLMLAVLSGSAGVTATAAPTRQTPQSQPSRPILLTDPVADPKQQGVQWFAQTGHTLRGAFLDYWNKYGGLAQFGYPLTEEFFEEVGTDHKQYQVQYFERNRFELHPENAGTQYEVLLGTLGREFHQQDAPATPITEANATYFKETGHNLSGAFKSYWDTRGGLFVHGYPITEPAMEKSTKGKEYLVQWFERSRFELHPENAGGPYEVLLGVLGRELSEKKGYPSGSYPRYGHAPDYSWVAGYYTQDPTKCPLCGCWVVRLVNPDNRTYLGVRDVQPHDQDLPLKERQINTTIKPEKFVVVFGQLDDPNSVATRQTTVSCLSPTFKVSGFQFSLLH